jgi:hypothetical protein
MIFNDPPAKCEADSLDFVPAMQAEIGLKNFFEEIRLNA